MQTRFIPFREFLVRNSGNRSSPRAFGVEQINFGLDRRILDRVFRNPDLLHQVVGLLIR